MENPEGWSCPAENWYVLRRFSLGGTTNNPGSKGRYSSIANLNRHIKRKHEGEGILRQKREFLFSF